MCEAADERELVVAVMLGPDDDTRIAPGGSRKSTIGVREFRKKCVVIHIADSAGLGVKACALGNPAWSVRHGPDGEWVLQGEEVTAEPRRLERSFNVRSAANVQRWHVGINGATGLRDRLTRSGLRHHMRSEVTPRPETELTCDRELRIGELDRRGIWHRETDSVCETTARLCIAGANRAEQIFRALALLLQTESEGGVRIGRAGHADPLSRACVRTRLKEDDGSRARTRSWSWAQPFPRTWTLRPSAIILRLECVAVNPCLAPLRLTR
jgi:hypothetical protein